MKIRYLTSSCKNIFLTSRHTDLTSRHKELTNQHKDLTSRINYLTSDGRSMPPYFTYYPMHLKYMTSVIWQNGRYKPLFQYVILK